MSEHASPTPSQEEEENGSPYGSRKSLSLPNSPASSRKSKEDPAVLRKAHSVQSFFTKDLPEFVNKMTSGTKGRAKARMDAALQVPEDGTIPKHEKNMELWPGEVIRGGKSNIVSVHPQLLQLVDKIEDPWCKGTWYTAYNYKDGKTNEIMILWKIRDGKGFRNKKKDPDRKRIFFLKNKAQLSCL